MSTTEEQKIKKAIKLYIEKHGGFWSVVTGGPWSKPGDPDIVACFKGRYVGIEGKVPSKDLEELQKVRREQIIACGGICFRADSVADVELNLKKYGLI